MGNQKLELTTNEPQESYRIKHYNFESLPDDFRNLIIAPFLNSLRYGNDLYKLIDKDAYYSSYTKYIEILMRRPDCLVTIALLNDNTALGWCMHERKTIHYVWVKKEVRRQGIGRSLMPKEFDTISHITNKGINIWVNHYPNVKFDPFA